MPGTTGCSSAVLSATVAFSMSGKPGLLLQVHSATWPFDEADSTSDADGPQSTVSGITTRGGAAFNTVRSMLMGSEPLQAVALLATKVTV